MGITTICSTAALVVASLTLSASPAWARLEAGPTPEQVRDDVALVLKRLHIAEYARFAETGRFSADLAELKIALPAFLVPFGALKIRLDKETNGGKGYLAEFIGPASTAKIQPKYSIDHTGSLRGMAQYSTSRELVADIVRNLKAIYRSEAAYRVEAGKFEPDLAKIGYAVPSYLRKYVKLTFAIDPKSGGFAYKATFKGVAYPIQGRIFTIDETGKISGF